MAEQPQQNVGQEKEEVSEHDWDEMFKKGKFKKQEMNKLIMDFFISHELTHVAQKFHSESGCPLGIRDISMLETQKTVRDLILNRKIDEAINLLDEKLHRTFVLDRPRMHFYMDQQKMIDMCSRGDFEAALTFSYELVMWDYYDYYIDFEKRVRQTLLLMLYGDDKHSPAAALLNPTRWSILARKVVNHMIIYQGRQPGRMIDKARTLLRIAEEDIDDEMVRFPKFNHDSGYPELLPH